MDCEKGNQWSLQTRISKLLQNESTSDLVFLIGKSAERYLCHKVILAAGSPVFETMFFGSMKQKSPVCVPDVTSKGFSPMLQYLYSDSLTIHDEAEAFEAAYPAKKYMIKSMFNICENFLISHIVLNPRNIFVIYEEASFLEMKKLQDYCLRYVSRNAREILLSESFLKISKEICLDILMLDFMNIESEMELIQSLWLWGEHQCKEKGLRCINENIREYTKDFLKYIRFLSLDMDELVSILRKCQILDTSDELAILWNFAMPSTRKNLILPPDICTETKTRSFQNCAKIVFPGVFRCDGNLTAFLTENSESKIEITVTGSPVTVIGIVIAFKPIACYSKDDRSLKIQIHSANISSNTQTLVKSRFKVEDDDSNKEQKQLILLGDYIVIEENQILRLRITVSGEGVKFMQYTEETIHHDFGKSKIFFKLDHSKEKNNMLFAMKELIMM